MNILLSEDPEITRKIRHLRIHYELLNEISVYELKINNASETEQNKHTNKTCLPIKP